MIEPRSARRKLQRSSTTSARGARSSTAPRARADTRSHGDHECASRATASLRERAGSPSRGDGRRARDRRYPRAAGSARRRRDRSRSRLRSRTELAQRDDIGDRGLDGHGWYGPSASPQPQRGIGAPGCELITARPHSRYPTKAERNSGSSGRRRAAEHLADERGHGLRVVRIHPGEHGRGRRGVKVTAAWVVPEQLPSNATPPLIRRCVRGIEARWRRQKACFSSVDSCSRGRLMRSLERRNRCPRSRCRRPRRSRTCPCW